LKEVSFDFFRSSIYPKLKDYEKLSWSEIERQTHGREGKSKSHFVTSEELSSEAKNRIRELKIDNTNQLYSLRLEGKLRIWGFRSLNYLDILWVDPSHEVCPSSKD
jgi:hypothetical protein